MLRIVVSKVFGQSKRFLNSVNFFSLQNTCVPTPFEHLSVKTTDRGFSMMEIAAFDGSTSADTLFNYGDWFRQFGTMVTSKTGTTSPIGITANYKGVADAMLKVDVIPSMVLHA